MPDTPIVISDADRLGAYLKCEQAILLGHQSYTVDGMTFTRADLWRVQQTIDTLRSRLVRAESGTVGGIRTTQVVF